MTYKVSGNDIVNNSSQFVGAYSKGMNPALKLLTIGDASTLTITSSGNNSTTNSSCKLSNNNFLFLTKTNTSFICALTTVNSSNVITVGNFITIAPAGITSTNLGMLQRLSDTSALMVFADSGALRALVLTISGTTVSAGTTYNLDTPVGTGSAQLQSIARISSPTSPTRFLVAYAVPNASNLYETKLRTIDVSGTVVTANTSYTSHTAPSTSGSSAIRSIVGLHDRDTDVHTGYNFFCTEPSVYTGTWSRDTTGLVTITVTELALKFGFNPNTRQFVVADIIFTSGATPPAGRMARLYITGIDTGTYQVSSSGESATWNIASSGDCEVRTSFLYSRSFDISGTTITNITSSGGGRKIDTGLSLTSSASEIAVFKTGDAPYVGTSAILTDQNYLLFYRKTQGGGLFNSPFVQDTFHLNALTFNTNIWGNPGVGGGVNGGQHITSITPSNYTIDTSRNTLITLFTDSSYHYVFFAMYDTPGVRIRQFADSTLENTIREIALKPTDITIPSRTFRLNDNYPLKSVSEIPLLNRSNQLRGALFPLADPKKFLYAYGASNTNWTFRVLTFDNFV